MAHTINNNNQELELNNIVITFLNFHRSHIGDINELQNGIRSCIPIMIRENMSEHINTLLRNSFAYTIFKVPALCGFGNRMYRLRADDDKVYDIVLNSSNQLFGSRFVGHLDELE